jgi:hypothetical protein
MNVKRRRVSSGVALRFGSVLLIMLAVSGLRAYAKCGYPDYCPYEACWYMTCTCEDYGSSFTECCTDCGNPPVIPCGWATVTPYVVYGYNYDVPPGFWCPPPDYCDVGYWADCSSAA